MPPARASDTEGEAVVTKYLNVQLSKAQARAIVGIIEINLASGYTDMVQVFGAPAVGAAGNGARRITAALVKASHDDRMERAEVVA